MAFNFNWSPLAADASFYTRAQELLTTALNKSPKPPIIVDDILVNELNLGSVPPDLEILEIGDLAEDRFRGIFKMCYNGDAFLTLKTRVQANPLNTYLSNKPSFTSPGPLAAASGLTIPIQITLSEIRLSAFIILVFSRQKGVTLVFRNDPLESLKVSSTFDAIPFVREYLQKEIESQLRTLLMDELPLIIHRLSLRLFVPEYREQENAALAQESSDPAEEKPVDPLASPPQDPVDVSGNMIDPSQITSLSLESGLETQALFSQRNLLRLSALMDSHRTLSLFTPSMRDVVFRAWAGPTERGDAQHNSGKATPASAPSLTRANTFTSSHATSSSISDAIERPLPGTRLNIPSSASGLNLASKHNKPHGRKKKHRVVNLRKKKETNAGDELESISGDSATNSGTLSTATSEESPLLNRPKTPERREGELVTPQISPERDSKEPGHTDVGMTPPRYADITPRHSMMLPCGPEYEKTPRQSQYLPRPSVERSSSQASKSMQELHHTSDLFRAEPSSSSNPPSQAMFDRQQKNPQLSPSPFNSTQTNNPLSSTVLPALRSSSSKPDSDLSPAQTAWMANLASLLAQKMRDQGTPDLAHSGRGFDPSSASKAVNRYETGTEDGGEAPPPAYAA